MSRIYANCGEAINEIERDIHEMGITVHPHSMQNKIVKDDKNFSTKEVQNYTFTILTMKDKDSIINNRAWCKAEFLERVAPGFKNPGTAWKLRQEVWEEFLVDGKFEYTYNERLQWQIEGIITELKENPDTRQAIIQIHDRNIDASRMRTLRIPCSMYYQFMIRGGKLDIIYNMRSSDFDTHFTNDIWLADELRNYIAQAVGIPPGIFHMNIGSLHRYKNYTKHVF